jgi:hypothetical protein
MPSHLEYASSSPLIARCQALQAVTKPGSRALGRCMEDYRLIISEDHYEMMHRSVGVGGRPLAPLAESTLKKKSRGPGPALIPRFFASRFISNVQVAWDIQEGLSTVVKRFIDIVSKKGVPFVKYHLDGATKPGTRWVLPRRDVGPVTPAGFSQLRQRFQKFVYDMAVYESGRGI